MAFALEIAVIIVVIILNVVMWKTKKLRVKTQKGKNQALCHLSLFLED
jgi:hypothetical protein